MSRVYGPDDVVTAKEIIARTYDYVDLPTFDEPPIEPPVEIGNDAQLVEMHLAQAQLAAQLGLIHASARHLWDSALAYVASPRESGWDPVEALFWWRRRYPAAPWPLATRYPDAVKSNPREFDDEEQLSGIAAGLDSQAPDNAG